MTKTDMLTNLKSGFYISLIALPLCLGISIASSFPPIAGILTAIIGGMIVSLISGGNLTIKGPAAGLIAIVLASVQDLGNGDVMLGYKRTLAVGVLAALLQILFALFKMGRFGRLMPPSVIHGMLAAIGIIIISKQVHILVGAIPHGKSPIELIGEIPQSLVSMNPELAFIGIFTLIMVLLIPLAPSKLVKSIPPALVALLVVVPLGLLWHIDIPHQYNFFGYDFPVGPQFLVNIPDNILNSFAFPDFSVLKEAIAYKYVLMLALVGSVESVLTVIAMDPLSNRKSDLDRDLLGVGIGNLMCSMIGGLPMIAEVVRSKANIDNGATTRWSNFFHGGFLLIAVSLLTPIIKEIPLAALAAMLIITGFRLASPKQFLHAHKVGFDQLTLFVTTLLVTLATDLLMGVLAGMALKILLHAVRGAGFSHMFSMDIRLESSSTTTIVRIFGPATFTNFLSLQKQIIAITTPNIVLDFSKATLVDHTTLSCLHNLVRDLPGVRVEITGLEQLQRSSGHEFSTHRYFRA